MATPVIMPRQGQSVESCIITKWEKQVGDSVAVGDILFSYETDKASFEEDAKVVGKMLAIFFEEGDDVECLKNVCVIGKDGESFAEFNPVGADTAPAPEAPVAKTKEAVKIANAVAPVATVSNENVFISPRAKNLAQVRGVDYRYAVATGPNGRIIERDVRALIDSGVMVTGAAMGEYMSMDNAVSGTGIGGRVSIGDLTAPVTDTAPVKVVSETREVPLTNIRKFIAKAMHTSLSTMAQLTLNASFDATEILAYRNKIKDNKDRLSLANITLNDIILFAVSRTLKNHEDLNAHFCDDKMVYFKNVNLGMAVDSPRGLIVPTIFNANNLSLNEIATQSKELAASAGAGTISPDLIKGGTFTITNLGSLGIETFTPVINPPQIGILGVNTIETKVKEVNGEYKYYPSMSLSLTFDHRAVDGAPAAKFLKELRENLENFSILLAK